MPKFVNKPVYVLDVEGRPVVSHVVSVPVETDEVALADKNTEEALETMTLVLDKKGKLVLDEHGDPIREPIYKPKREFSPKKLREDMRQREIESMNAGRGIAQSLLKEMRGA